METVKELTEGTDRIQEEKLAAGQNKETVGWDEAAIRKEIRRLDKKTGLNGAALPIIFTNAWTQLGSFWRDDMGNAKEFRFSKRYFHDPNFTVKEALDVIRHEYAHYMNLEIYGNRGHGGTWKLCCKKVGANPFRLYTDEWKNAQRRRHAEEVAVSEMCDIITEEMEILHPEYGAGVVKQIEGEGARRTLRVDFPEAGSKKLSAGWVFANCWFQ